MPTGLIFEADEAFRGRLRDCLDSAGMWTLTASTAAEFTNALATGGVDVIVFGVGPDEQQETLRLAADTKRCFPRTELILISREPLPRLDADVKTLAKVCSFDEPLALCLLRSCARQFVERHFQLNRLAHLGRLLQLTPDALNGSECPADSPAICISMTGRVLIAAPRAVEILRSVSVERSPKPAEIVDPFILGKLRDAMKADNHPVETVFHRRDGHNSHYRAYLQAVQYRAEQAILVVFQEAGDLEGDHVDQLWLELLERAARSRD